MHEIFLKAETLFYIGVFPVTNTLLLSVFVLFFLVLGSVVLRFRMRFVPGGAQNIAEVALEALLGLMDSVLGSRRKSERYLPFIATLFLFILTANWFGVLPGVGSLVLKDHGHALPLFRSPASDLNVTLALATLTVVFVNAAGIAALGLRLHVSKFFNFKGPIQFFVGILELISEFARVISFAFRLFGNVFAGEVLLVVIAALVPLIAPVPFFTLELFVGFIQAFVFAMLALVFITIATADHREAY